MYLCVCKGVSESQLRNALDSRDCKLSDFRCETGMGTKCGVCRKSTKQFIQQHVQTGNCNKT